MKCLLLLFILISIHSGCTKKINSAKKLDEERNYYSQENPNLFNYKEITNFYFLELKPNIYKALGIGGGGAYSGFSLSPYAQLWFVGTDMGTLFRSINQGKTWNPVSHFQTSYASDLKSSVSIGFSANPQIVFHAPGGINPMRSIDGGVTWKSITQFPLTENEAIKYWRANSYDSKIMFAGTNLGLWISNNSGKSFTKLDILGDSIGTYIDYLKNDYYIYHALSDGIYLSKNHGVNFEKIYGTKNIHIRDFAAGRDKRKITFAFIDDNGRSACSNLNYDNLKIEKTKIDEHYNHCGYVWISHSGYYFKKTNKEAGDFIRMSENDSDTIYVTGSTSWIKQYGTKIWRSIDAGENWELKLHQYNWDINPFEAWPANLIEYSAVALDIGWFDSGYESFDVNLRHSNELGGTGYFFLHTSINSGDFWNAPFTKFADIGEMEANKKWKSTGLEVTSVYNLKIHPTNSKIIYASMADLGGMISEDAGSSFRITRTIFNSTYDYAFDPDNSDLVWAAAGDQHDFPIDSYGYPTQAEGGIFFSNNKGLTWNRSTPISDKFNHQFLTIRFDHKDKILYAGSQGQGIIRSKNRGIDWEFVNDGLPNSPKIIPQIEIDPINGDVYALLSGDPPYFTNQAQTGIYKLDKLQDKWILLRGKVTAPEEKMDESELWFYPTNFAVDFSINSNRSTLWLVDYENNNNWKKTGVWKSIDYGKTWVRQIQFTHPLSIVLDPNNSNKVYVSGLWKVDGSWGNGGLMFSKNGGLTFENNLTTPYQANGRSVTLDLNNKNNIFYTFFGSSILYGPRPENIIKKH